MGKRGTSLEHRLSWDEAFDWYKGRIRPHTTDFWDDPPRDTAEGVAYWTWRDACDTHLTKPYEQALAKAKGNPTRISLPKIPLTRPSVIPLYSREYLYPRFFLPFELFPSEAQPIKPILTAREEADRQARFDALFDYDVPHANVIDAILRAESDECEVDPVDLFDDDLDVDDDDWESTRSGVGDVFEIHQLALRVRDFTAVTGLELVSWMNENDSVDEAVGRYEAAREVVTSLLNDYYSDSATVSLKRFDVLLKKPENRLLRDTYYQFSEDSNGISLDTIDDLIGLLHSLDEEFDSLIANEQSTRTLSLRDLESILGVHPSSVLNAEYKEEVRTFFARLHTAPLPSRYVKESVFRWYLEACNHESGLSWEENPDEVDELERLDRRAHQFGYRSWRDFKRRLDPYFERVSPEEEAAESRSYLPSDDYYEPRLELVLAPPRADVSITDLMAKWREKKERYAHYKQDSALAS